MEYYFKDNFFNAGYTDIMNEEGKAIGSIDLKSSFGSSLEVLDGNRYVVCSAKFRMFSHKWEVRNEGDQLIGVLRPRFSMFSKRYEYEANGRDTYEITSGAFSKDYSIQGFDGQTVAMFSRTSGWLQSGAFCLHNTSAELGNYELIAVVMGVHAIQKAQNSNV